MGDWEIKRPLGECSGSGRKIENGQEYYGALVETEQGLERRDFSVGFWNRPSRASSASGGASSRPASRRNRSSWTTGC